MVADLKKSQSSHPNGNISSSPSKSAGNFCVVRSSKCHSPRSEPKQQLIDVWLSYAGKRNPENIASCRAFDSACFDPSEYARMNKVDMQFRESASLRFAEFASLLATLELEKNRGSGSKTKCMIIMTNLLRLLLWCYPSDVGIVFSLLPDKAHGSRVDLGVGESMIVQILSEIHGKAESAIREYRAVEEDLSEVAEKYWYRARTLFPHQRLTLNAVSTAFENIAHACGPQSQRLKKDKIKKLLAAANKLESKYLIRFLLCRARLGIQLISLSQAFAYACVLTPPSSHFGFSCSDVRKKGIFCLRDIRLMLSNMVGAVRNASARIPNMEQLVKQILDGASIEHLPKYCVIMPGCPIGLMLAKPAKNLDEIMRRFTGQKFTCEFKYDGERAQLHFLNGGKIELYTRNGERVTQKYPDVVNICKAILAENVKSLIVDSEIVAYDASERKLLPFQVLSTRKRKRVEQASIEVDVCIFAFDCMYLNGCSLLNLPLASRRQALYDSTKELNNKYLYAHHREVTTKEEVHDFFLSSLKFECEGLMVKSLENNSCYDATKRSDTWLKLKKDYLEGLADTFDLVPIGGFYGKGKRVQTYGAFLLACYSPSNQKFQTICKLGTGFTDDDLKAFQAMLDEARLPQKKPSYEVNSQLNPDVWFDTVTVWEVRAANLSLSPVHTAACGLRPDARGIGLRFPRFIRVRTDKSPVDGTTAHEILEMYLSQFEKAIAEHPNGDLGCSTLRDESGSEAFVAS